MRYVPTVLLTLLLSCLWLRLPGADPVDSVLGQADALRSISEERVMREYRRLIDLHGQDPDWPEGVRAGFDAFRARDRSRLVDDLASFADGIEDPEARAQVLLRCAFHAREAGRESAPFEARATAVVSPGPARARILLRRIPGKDGATRVLLLRAALAEDPANLAIYQDLMPELIEQERWAEAVALAESWLTLQPEDTLRLGLAALNLRLGKAELAECQARACFRGADPGPGDENAVAVAACALLAQGLDTQAKALVESCPIAALRRHPFQPMPSESLHRLQEWSAKAVQARQATRKGDGRTLGIDSVSAAEEEAQRQAALAKAEAARNASRAALQAKAARLAAAEEAARCPDCAGTKAVPVRCPLCAGSGLEDGLVATGERRQSREVEGPYMRYRFWRERLPCRTCQGEGEVLRKCPTCQGTGRRP